jgi:hypothetical protein
MRKKLLSYGLVVAALATLAAPPPASRPPGKILATAALPQQEKQTMKTLYIAALTLAMITAASAQHSTTFRDASGRTTGTATTDSNGTTTFRDGSGRTTGTASTPRR